MGTVLALLLPAIPSIVNLVENLFSKKSNAGTDKLNSAQQMLQVLLSQLEAAGLIPTGSVKPTPDAIQGAIEAVLAQLKASGQLGSTSAGTLYLVQGVVTPLNPLQK